MRSVVQRVIIHLPKDGSNQPKVEGMLSEWELISAERKTLRMKLASSLSVMWLRSLCAVVREMPWNPPQTCQRRLTLQHFITSATSVRGLKSCDSQHLCSWVFFFFFFPCSGSSGSCLNTAEFAQVPEDGLNAACCIRCHTLSCITWTFVATCLDTDLLCVSNMWIKWYWGKSMRLPDELCERRWIRWAFNEISVQGCEVPQSKQIRDFHALQPGWLT